MRPRFASRRAAFVGAGAVCLAGVAAGLAAVVARSGSNGCVPVRVYGRGRPAIGEVLGSSAGSPKVYVWNRDSRLLVGSGDPIRWRPERTVAPGRLLGALPRHGHDVLYAGGWALYRSDDGGRSWQRLSCGRVVDGAAVAAGRTNLVYLAADVSDAPPHGRGGPYRSRDGGRGWGRVSVLPPLDATVQAVAVDPLNPKDVTVALGAGGVARSLDGGRTWSFSAMGFRPAGPAGAG